MTAASGMKAQQMQVDTIANNIANVNTVAFKKNELAFRDMFYQTYREPGAPGVLPTQSWTDQVRISKSFDCIRVFTLLAGFSMYEPQADVVVHAYCA